MNVAKRRIISRKKRAFSVRKDVSGTAECPRLCVRRSLKHIVAQLIDDTTGKSLVQVVSYGKSFSSEGLKTKTDVSARVGELIAQKALDAGIEKVVFDRKGYRYHGRVKALAEAARSKGLKF